MTKALPPNRPPGIIDLLDSGDPAPEDALPDASWRADALGRSLHSRLADEMRAPAHNPNPARAELVCARIARDVLSDYAPAMLLLSAEKRRRLQTLTAWAVTLFDLALHPGLAGLDGDRLAQINAWEFQTEEALDATGAEQPSQQPAGQPTGRPPGQPPGQHPGQPPGQPIFIAMGRADREQAWPRQALDRIVAGARTAAVGRSTPHESGHPNDEDIPAAFLEALFGTGHSEAAQALAPLVRAAAGRESPDTRHTQPKAPRGWRRAIGYGQRVAEFKRRSGDGVYSPLDLFTRLRLLVTAAILR